MMLALVVALMAAQYPPRAILVVGQSVAVGVTDSQLTSTPSLVHYMPGGNELGGPFCGYGGCFWTSPTAWPPEQYREPTWVSVTTGTLIESPRGGLLAEWYAETAEPIYILHNGVGGYSYAQLERGTEPFRVYERSVEAFGARVPGATLQHMAVIHGESNYSDAKATYLGHLVEWRTDVENKARASGVDVGAGVVAYLSQPSGWTNSIFNLVHSQVPDAMVQAAEDYPTQFKLVGPQYDLTYRDVNHPNTASSYKLGARIGRAMADPDWQPVWPLSVTRDGATITMLVHAPTPPLVEDTVSVTDPGGLGFTFTDDGTPPTVTGVDCTSEPCVGNTCTCIIVLSGTPSGANKKLRYAYTVTRPANPGPTTGPRGCIRDSAGGAAGPNWMVHFDEAVP